MLSLLLHPEVDDVPDLHLLDPEVNGVLLRGTGRHEGGVQEAGDQLRLHTLVVSGNVRELPQAVEVGAGPEGGGVDARRGGGVSQCGGGCVSEVRPRGGGVLKVRPRGGGVLVVRPRGGGVSEVRPQGRGVLVVRPRRGVVQVLVLLLHKAGLGRHFHQHFQSTRRNSSGGKYLFGDIRIYGFFYCPKRC